MTIRFGQKTRQSAVWWPSDSDSLYRLWVMAPTQVVLRIAAQVVFTRFEADAASLWSTRQAPIGLRAAVHNTLGGAASVVEVFGPDDLVPHCIIYATATGVQVDEFSGDSRVYPSLPAALHEIAPIS